MSGFAPNDILPQLRRSDSPTLLPPTGILASPLASRQRQHRVKALLCFLPAPPSSRSHFHIGMGLRPSCAFDFIALQYSIYRCSYKRVEKERGGLAPAERGAPGNENEHVPPAYV